MSVNDSINIPLKIAISPCPNDTFAFYHFLNDSGNIGKYEPVFLDIEELNLGMIQKKWDIVKASFPMGATLQDSYELLPSGSALGYGVGPIAIYSDENVLKKDTWIVGLPGEHTTANFLWNYYSNLMRDKIAKNIVKKYLFFGDVMKKTEAGELDMGIIIHEGRFVYKDLNLKLYQDLGEFWEKKTGLPVPLGGIFIKKNLSETIKQMVKTDLKASVSQALIQKAQDNEEYKKMILPYIKQYSRELSEQVIEKHIEYYVNADTIELTGRSRQAIELMFSMLKKDGIVLSK